MNQLPSTKCLFCFVVIVLFVSNIVVPSICSQCDPQHSISFGSNSNGQLGDGTTTSSNIPVSVSTSGVLNGTTITDIDAGFYHSFVLSSTGQVFSFGFNGYGQLGDGTTTDSNIPVAVYTAGDLNGKTITAIAAGAYHSLVLSSSGQVFSFGYNGYGQLGDGTNTDSNIPVAVYTSGDLNGKTITAIAAGGRHSLVLSSSGQVFGFGNNGNGQLGDGTTTNSNIPVAVYTSGVLNGKTITAIAAGGYHSLVLSSTGEVFSFGWNQYGQLGDGTNTNSNTPVAVSTSGVLNGKTITAIAAGLYHSLVLSSTGRVFSFGANYYGQLGYGTFTDSNTPVAVSTSGVLNGTTITAISGATGKLFSFGYNSWGQLGDDTNTDRNIPVAVSRSGVLNGTTITAISVGGHHSLVLGMECVNLQLMQDLPDLNTLIRVGIVGMIALLVLIIITTTLVEVLVLCCFTVFVIRNCIHSNKSPPTPIVPHVIELKSPSVSMISPEPIFPVEPSIIEPNIGTAPPSWGNSPNFSIESSFISPEEFSDFHKIGNGAYGTVFMANYRGTAVAVKVLDLDTDHGKEFLQEAMTMAQLRHPRLLQFVGYCNSNGKFGIVTEFMDRGSLDLWLWKKTDPNMSIPWPMKMTILRDVGSGMAFLHSKGFLHRDLKSPNILIGSDFRAKVGDFGLARVVDKATSTMTNNQGTPMWMAPEVIGGTGHYDNKCDVFSFGIIMWEVMIEKEPYHDVPNKQTVMVNVFNNPNFRPTIPSLEEVVSLHNTEEDKKSIPNVFEAFTILMQACWAHDPSSRPTFDQVVEQLNRMGGATF